jgi:hypothetical protein
MKTKLLMICLLGIITASCNNTSDGTYIVYSTWEPDRSLNHLASPSERNDFSISSKVSQQMKGRKFVVTFNDKFVTMKPLDVGKEILLDRSNHYYMEKRTDTVYHTGVSLDGKMTDIVLTVHLKQDEPKASLRLKTYSHPTDSIGNSGFVQCELSKVKSN